MQNLHDKVPPQAWPAFKALVADMRDAPTFAEGQRRQQPLLAQPALAASRRRLARRGLGDGQAAPLGLRGGPTPNRLLVRNCDKSPRAAQGLPSVLSTLLLGGELLPHPLGRGKQGSVFMPPANQLGSHWQAMRAGEHG
jgi:hypothetical protein